MKIILIILSLFVVFNINSQLDGFKMLTQEKISLENDSKEKLNINLIKEVKKYNSDRKLNSDSMLGPGMIIGGTAFLIAGLLTNTNIAPGTSQNPIYDLNKYLAMGTGATFLTIGIIITISDFR